MTMLGLHVPALLLGNVDGALDGDVLAVLFGNMKTFLDGNSFRN